MACLVCALSVEYTPVEWIDGRKEAIYKKRKEGHVNEKLFG